MKGLCLVLALCSCQAAIPDEWRVGVEQGDVDLTGNRDADLDSTRLSAMAIYRPKPFRREIVERLVERRTSPPERPQPEVDLRCLSGEKPPETRSDSARDPSEEHSGPEPENPYLTHWIAEAVLTILLGVFGVKEYRKRRQNHVA